LLLGAALVVAVLAVTLAFKRRDATGPLATATVDRADILEVVGATGALEAVVTVQVGSQVSGTIQNLYVDFNSHVKKGQVLARLDPSLFEARLGQAKANLISARANVERAKAQASDTQQKFERAKELAAEKLVPLTDLESAKANNDAALAQLKANEAAVSQAQANVNQADVDLDHTVISTPIDGVVIARNVDVGQTVAASFQAPVLFVIAQDLTKMRVNAAIDEADVGRVEPGQDVTFRVDAYPDRPFAGRLEQVRLQPTTVQNVVTYNTIVSVDNDQLKLRPGMTATVSVIVRKADQALRIPASALRYRPEGAPAPGRGGPPSGGVQAAGGPPAGGAAPPEGARPAGPGGPGGGRPDGGGRPGGFRRGEGGGRPSDGTGRGRPTTVYVMDEEGNPKPTSVVLGITDGQFVEVREGLEEGAKVVVGAGVAGERGPRTAASPSSNPFNPQFQRRQR
ncbi:MAG TPA: efflux RND transporter periplasmic adaptor subunit, partial [Acidimicrobiales bacterium]